VQGGAVRPVTEQSKLEQDSFTHKNDSYILTLVPLHGVIHISSDRQVRLQRLLSEGAVFDGVEERSHLWLVISVPPHHTSFVGFRLEAERMDGMEIFICFLFDSQLGQLALF